MKYRKNSIVSFWYKDYDKPQIGKVLHDYGKFVKIRFENIWDYKDNLTHEKMIDKKKVIERV